MSLANILTDFEIEILRECAGIKEAQPWGAAVGAAFEALEGNGLVRTDGSVTLEGREKLIELGYDEAAPDIRLRDFALLNKRRCEAADGFNHAINEWSLSDWMTALTGELGEAANIIKKMNRHRDGVTNTGDPSMQELRVMLAKELADIDIYLDLMYQRVGIDRPAAIRSKFNETSEKIGSPIRL